MQSVPAYAWRVLVLIPITGILCLGAAAQKKSGTPSAAPSPASPTPSGASPSNAPIEVEWLAYGALDEVLQKVADLSCGSRIGTFPKVVVIDPPSLQALEAYDTFYEQAESLNAAFADMAPQTGAGGGIDEFADITNAIVAAAVSTTSESSFTFTIQDPTAAAILLGKLHEKASDGCKSAYYGGVYEVSDIADAKTSIDVDKEHPDKGKKKLPSVPDELVDLAATRALTLRSVLGQAGSNPKTCKAAVTAVQGAPAGTTAVSSQDPCITAFNNIDGAYNSFLSALWASNSTTGQSGISAAIQGYKLRALFQTSSASSPVLGIYLSVATAGGTQQDRKNLFTAIFTGDLIRYSGGVSVNVILFKVAAPKSAILFSDLVRYRTPLTTIKAPVPHKALNEGDNLKVLSK
jgi:hypothetical protein